MLAEIQYLRAVLSLCTDVHASSPSRHPIFLQMKETRESLNAYTVRGKLEWTWLSPPSSERLQPFFLLLSLLSPRRR
jgi:hypothetical protein